MNLRSTISALRKVSMAMVAMGYSTTSALMSPDTCGGWRSRRARSFCATMMAMYMVMMYWATWGCGGGWGWGC